MRVGLIACSKSKGPSPAPARSLYRGALFRKSLAYAEATCDAVVILSAKFMVVKPDDVIPPYDASLYEMTKAEKQNWADQVVIQLAAMFPAATLVYFTPDAYEEMLLPGERPITGMRLGPRLRWFNEQLKAIQSRKVLKDAPQTN